MIFLEMISRKPLGLFLKICTKHFIFCTKTIKSSPRFFPNVESFFLSLHNISPPPPLFFTKVQPVKKRGHKQRETKEILKTTKTTRFYIVFE